MFCFLEKMRKRTSVGDPVSEFNEVTRLKSPKNRFQLSAGFNLEKFNTIFSGSNHI